MVKFSQVFPDSEIVAALGQQLSRADNYRAAAERIARRDLPSATHD